jgi:hypothetical protein
MIRGEKKFDMWHGLNSLFVLYWRILIAREVKDKDGKIKKLGEGYNSERGNDLLVKYVTNKFSPTFGALWRFVGSSEKTDASGNKFIVDQFGNVYNTSYLQDLFTPIYYGAVYEIAKDDPDAYEAFLTAVGSLGLGISGKKTTENWYDMNKKSEGFQLPKPPSPPKPPTPNY